MKIFIKIFLLALLTGCGQPPLSNSSIVLNSLYLNLQYGVSERSFSLSEDLFNQDTTDFNNRSGENILFVPNTRLVTFSYGKLDEGILGLTVCTYNADQTSSCTITLSDTINPDKAVSQADSDSRTQMFVGVLRHELGHAFGLGHFKDDPNHVMFPYFKPQQLGESNVTRFINDLKNFRINGPASGLPTISVK